MGFLSWWKSWWKISRNLVGNLVILTHQANHLNYGWKNPVAPEAGAPLPRNCLGQNFGPLTYPSKGRKSSGKSAVWGSEILVVEIFWSGWFCNEPARSPDCVVSPFFQKSKGPHISFKKQQTIVPRSECGFNIWRVFKKPKKNCQHPCLPEFKKPKQYNKIQKINIFQPRRPVDTLTSRAFCPPPSLALSPPAARRRLWGAGPPATHRGPPRPLAKQGGMGQRTSLTIWIWGGYIWQNVPTLSPTFTQFHSVLFKKHRNQKLHPTLSGLLGKNWMLWDAVAKKKISRTVRKSSVVTIHTASPILPAYAMESDPWLLDFNCLKSKVMSPLPMNQRQKAVSIRIHCAATGG